MTTRFDKRIVAANKTPSLLRCMFHNFTQVWLTLVFSSSDFSCSSEFLVASSFSVSVFRPESFSSKRFRRSLVSASILPCNSAFSCSDFSFNLASLPVAVSTLLCWKAKIGQVNGDSCDPVQRTFRADKVPAIEDPTRPFGPQGKCYWSQIAPNFKVLKGRSLTASSSRCWKDFMSSPCFVTSTSISFSDSTFFCSSSSLSFPIFWVEADKLAWRSATFLQTWQEITWSHFPSPPHVLLSWMYTKGEGECYKQTSSKIYRTPKNLAQRLPKQQPPSAKIKSRQGNYGKHWTMLEKFPKSCAKCLSVTLELRCHAMNSKQTMKLSSATPQSKETKVKCTT